MTDTERARRRRILAALTADIEDTYPDADNTRPKEDDTP